MSFEITFEKLFGQPTCKSAPLEGHMTADSVKVLILTSNLMLFDRKRGYSECEKDTHSMEHNCCVCLFLHCLPPGDKQINGVGVMRRGPGKFHTVAFNPSNLATLVESHKLSELFYMLLFGHSTAAAVPCPRLSTKAYKDIAPQNTKHPNSTNIITSWAYCYRIRTNHRFQSP